MDEDFDIAQLLKLRKLTRSIADYLARELGSHLTTLAPLLNPRLIFGEHIRGGPKISRPTAARAVDELQSLYQSIHHAPPFNLRPRYETPIALLSASLEIQPASYNYTADDGIGGKTIHVISPLKWILSFDGFGPARLTELLTTDTDAAGTRLQECVLHYLLLHLTLQKSPGVRRLLQALRFSVTNEQLPEFGKLPLIILSAPLPTVRPNDKAIVESTEISGTRNFEEVVDADASRQLADPLQQKLIELSAT